MLVITRRMGERIIIQDQIKITAIAVRGNQVRLGIEAPREISVHREEIYERIRSSQQIQPEEPSEAIEIGEIV